MRRFIAATALLFAAPLLAHDFWIEPSNYHPKRGETVDLQLVVGQSFDGDALPRNPALLQRFDATSRGRTTPVAGEPGFDPAGELTMANDGVTLVSYVSRGSVAEMTPEKFRQYVADEGLEWALQERIKRGVAGKPVHDNFSRCAKSLLNNGASHAGFDHVVGMTFEIVPLSDPFGSGDLKVRLLFHGKPAPNVSVTAIARQNPTKRISVRSDARGIASLSLPSRDEWLIKAVQLVPSSLPNVDYDSYWASLTFDSKVN